MSGGSPVTLTGIQRAWGGSWGDDDTIVFAEARQPGNEPIPPRLVRVSAAGGSPEVLRSVAGTEAVVDFDSLPLLAYPQLLPGGGALLYSSVLGGRNWSESQIIAERLATGERTVVVERRVDARYLESGHLIYRLDRTLLAVPFDVDRLEVTGGAVPVIEGVHQAIRGGNTQLDVSRNGTLAYLAGAEIGLSFVWVDRNGREESLGAPPGNYSFPRIAPDGTRVVVDDQDLWVWSFARETMTRLTFEPGGHGFPVWTPDSQRIVYTWGQSGATSNLYWRAADGTGTAERLLESPVRHAPHTISPDGSRLVFYEGGAAAGFDLYMMTLDDERRVEPLIVTEFNERNAEISPDGRWLAYQSDASGRLEIYVQPFPDVDAGRWQVSTNGGARALWAPDGRELFYMTNDGVMGMTVDVNAGSSFRYGAPELIVAGQYSGASSMTLAQNRTYDISPDGARFLMLKAGGATDADDPYAGLTQILVVQNWFQELLERVPVP